MNHAAGVVFDGVAAGDTRVVDPVLTAHVVAASLNVADEIGGFLSDRDREDVVSLCVLPVLFGLFSAPRSAAFAAPGDSGGATPSPRATGR